MAEGTNSAIAIVTVASSTLTQIAAKAVAAAKAYAHRGLTPERSFVS